jgi:hypothetical protein
VHEGAGRDDEHALRVALGPVRAGLVDRGHLVHVVHPDDADERAERQRPDSVLGLATPEAPQARAESDEELRGPHARPAGGHEVTEFVHEHGDEHADDEDEPPDVDGGEPHQQPDDGGHAQRAAPATGQFVVGLLVHGAARHHLVLEPVVLCSRGEFLECSDGD